MKGMRPFQIITISVFAVLALGGLYFFSTYKGFGGGKPVGDVMIWGTLPTSAMQTSIDTLRRTHQEFGKVLYVERPAATFDADLADALASGTGPDLIITTQEQLGGERNKLALIPFSSIPERTFRDTYLPINELFLTTGGTYGIPFAVDPLVLYYNRAILGTAGVAQAPTSWEAIVGLAPTLTKKSDAGVISRSTIPLGTYENVPHARAILSLLLLQSGSTITQNTTAGFRSTLATNGGSSTYGTTPAESAVTFYTQFANPAKIVYSWNRSLPDGRQSFISGDSAFYIGFASERKLLSSSNPNLDFDMAPIPGPETAQVKIDYAVAYAFAIPKNSKNNSGAYRTAMALSAKDADGAAAALLMMAPAQRSLLNPNADDIYSPIFYPQALIAKGWLSPTPLITDRIFADMINNIISGRQSVHDALYAADQSLTAAL